MKILTVEQMKTEERLSDEMGVTYQRLMENAGCAAATVIRKTLSNVVGRNFMIFCGSGNNGGDGFVVARKLFEEGANVIVVLCGGIPRSDEAKYMYNCVIQAGITTLDFVLDRKKVDEFLGGADIIIDALFGTGFTGEFRAPYDEIAEMINSDLAVKISLDIPSGVNAETGLCAENSIKANFTVAFEAAKPGHLLLPGKEFCGQTEVVDIGIPHEVRAQVAQNCFLTSEEMVFSSIRRRPRFSNKGTFGKLLCITGSANFPGAAVLSALSAMRAGAGITTVASTEKVVSMIAGRIPEATFLSLPENEDGTISASAKEKILPFLENVDAVLIGCGLGRGKDIGEIVEFVLENANCTVVLDADKCTELRTDQSSVTMSIPTDTTMSITTCSFESKTISVSQGTLSCTTMKLDGSTIAVTGQSLTVEECQFGTNTNTLSSSSINCQKAIMTQTTSTIKVEADITINECQFGTKEMTIEGT